MKVENVKSSNNWREIANAARTTVNMDEGTGEPKSSWKRKMLMAEHSPIRKLRISAKFKDLKSWVSVHLVRHKFGIEHFVATQRTDRTGVDRDELKQSELVTHEIEANAQAIINISRKRLCAQASTETRYAWRKFITKLNIVEPELASVCVPECVYRGHCPELNCCGYVKTITFLNVREEYVNGGSR